VTISAAKAFSAEVDAGSAEVDTGSARKIRQNQGI